MGDAGVRSGAKNAAGRCGSWQNELPSQQSGLQCNTVRSRHTSRLGTRVDRSGTCGLPPQWPSWREWLRPNAAMKPARGFRFRGSDRCWRPTTIEQRPCSACPYVITRAAYGQAVRPPRSGLENHDLHSIPKENRMGRRPALLRPMRNDCNPEEQGQPERETGGFHTGRLLWFTRA